MVGKEATARDSMSKMKRLRQLLFFLFFLSGLSALVYEVVWARQLSLVFGTTDTDNRPFLEFSAPKSLYRATTSKNLETLKDLRPNLFPQDSLWRKYFQARAHIVLGKMYFTRGEETEALAEYQEAFRIDPENRWLRLTLGRK